MTYEIFQAFNQSGFDNTLNPHLLEGGAIPTEAALCSDISITIDGRTFVGRLVLSQAFHKAWKEKYAVRTLDIPIESILAQKIELPVPLVVGSTTLKLEEWKEVKPGDFVALEYCSIDPTSDKGRVTLMVHGQPFYRARLKDGNLKILEHPLYFEAETVMAKQEPPQEEPKEEEFDETEFDLGEGEEAVATEEGGEADVEAILSQAEKRIKSMGEEEKAAPPAQPLLKPEEIPLSIVVEVGRLQMSVQKLLDLQPGNLLELNVRPETGVDLVVNGRRIGKGELLRIGEVLGVRVLDIG